MRREGRIGVVDLFLLLLLLLSLVGGLLRWQEAGGETELKHYRAVLLGETVPGESADCLAVGDRLSDASGTHFGCVTAIERLPAPIVIETDGGSVRGEWETSVRCRLRVEVELEGAMRGGVLLLGGTEPLGVGGGRVLFSERMRLEARLLGFSEMTS